MKMRTETPGKLILYGGSPTRSEKEQVSISSFYYKERVSARCCPCLNVWPPAVWESLSSPGTVVGAAAGEAGLQRAHVSDPSFKCSASCEVQRVAVC